MLVGPGSEPYNTVSTRGRVAGMAILLLSLFPELLTGLQLMWKGVKVRRQGINSLRNFFVKVI